MERRVAVVTGGTGGIGSAVCQRLAANYHVVACYFKNGKHEEAKQWQAAQKAIGYDIDIQYADIVNFSDCEQLTAVVKERYGSIDVLVNNAGISCDVSLKKMSPQQWQQVIDVDLTSCFRLCRSAIKSMIRKRFGRIINVTSVVATMGNAGQANYCAAKAGLIGMSKAMAREVATRGITINCIAPGFINSSMTKKIPDTLKEKMLQKIVNIILDR